MRDALRGAAPCVGAKPNGQAALSWEKPSSAAGSWLILPPAYERCSASSRELTVPPSHPRSHFPPSAARAHTGPIV